MSNEINHEGKTYILKSQVEGIVKERISKIASKAHEAEKRANELETSLADIQQRAASIDIISAQLEEMKGKLSASESRYHRFQAVSKYGITEPDIIEAIEGSYEKSMKNKPKKDHVSLEDWISNHIQSPDTAPILLRPHFMQVSKERAPQEEQSTQQQSTQQQQNTSVESNFVSTNQNTVKAPEQPNPTNQGLKSQKDWKANREAIRAAYYESIRRR